MTKKDILFRIQEAYDKRSWPAIQELITNIEQECWWEEVRPEGGKEQR